MSLFLINVKELGYLQTKTQLLLETCIKQFCDKFNINEA